MPSRIKSLDKRYTLSEAERRFRKACDQIVMLNQRLGEVQKRYKNAKKTNNRSFRYNLRLKLAVIEGSRNMFYDYAYSKADQVAELRRELFNESVEIVSGSDSEYSSDSDWTGGCKSPVVFHKRPLSEPTKYFERNSLSNIVK